MIKIFNDLKFDKSLIISILILVVIGIITFLSASLGILSNNELKFFSIIKTQMIYIFLLGGLAIFTGSKINYKYYKKYAVLIFLFTFLFSLTVFIPGLRFYYNGAYRWIHIFGLSIQPSELLKFGSIVFMSFFCTKYSKYFKNIKLGLIPFIIFVILIASSLLLQPDFGTFSVILIPAFVIYFVGGAKWRDILIILLSGILLFFILVEMRPYMKERILTFINPDRESLGAGYQLNQSLIAVGSGGIDGRGIGQSIQKFNYLPEQISDSIFAVYAEEVGFIGSILLFIVFLFIIVRGIHISKRADDRFGSLLAIGIITTFFFQTVLNIASTLGLAPLTGVPLPLISKGGTSFAFIMFELGVLLNISKYKIKI